MRTIYKLFGRSPFVSLQYHMSKVTECVDKVEEIFKALSIDNHEEVNEISKKISGLEHAADLAKDDIRNNLGKSIFLPVDKGKLLEILKIQDNIADKCEDIGVLLTMKKLKIIDSFKDNFSLFLQKNIETCRVAQAIIRELDTLLESSFSGIEAEKVKEMIDSVAYKEHEADKLQRKLLSGLFAHEEMMSYGTFIIWLRIFEEVGSLSDCSENLGDRVGAMLKIKGK
ncbi:MAG: TIGR00153 family protein [Candidatus Anammoxibacter sp.]